MPAESTGFRVAAWGKWNVLWLDSSRMEEGLAYYRKHQLDGIGLNWSDGYKLDNLRLLAEQPDIRGLVIVSMKSVDISGIENLTALRFLSLPKQKRALDLAAFPELVSYRGHWWKGLRIPAESVLEELALWSYAPTTRDLTALPDLPALERLELVRGTVESLRGVERIRGLKCLELAYLSKLSALHPVEELEELELLHLERCSRVGEYEILGKAPALKTLRITACAPIPSLGFVRSCRSLEFLSFVKTRLLDGDLTPTFGLRYVGFLNQRGLSHSPEEVKEILRSRAALR